MQVSSSLIKIPPSSPQSREDSVHFSDPEKWLVNAAALAAKSDERASRNRCRHRLSAHLLLGLVALFITAVSALEAQTANNTTFPPYDHVFLIIMENEGYNQVVGNQFAPILNALANDYGLATNYTGVADPSEPNYVAMLGGDFFGVNSDDPYWFPGQTVNAPNLMSQLEATGKTWRGYFQSMPYPGYRGYCYPDKCNGI